MIITNPVANTAYTVIGSSSVTWTPTAADVGTTHYIRAETTNSRTDFRRIRYDYLLNPITVTAVAAPTPTITSISLPNTVASSINQTITINGTNFSNSSTIVFIHPLGAIGVPHTPLTATANQLTYNSNWPSAVSYTHLTLPTILRV